jgi:hypothetical protein
MGGEKSAAGDMVYDPVSTGYGVYADPNFQPRVFDYHEPDTAAKIGVTPKTTEDGKLLEDKEDVRYSYGSFPYIGEIQFALHYFNKVISSEGLDTATQNLLDDINEMSSGGAEDEDDSGDSAPTSPTVPTTSSVSTTCVTTWPATPANWCNAPTTTPSWMRWTPC